MDILLVIMETIVVQFSQLFLQELRMKIAKRIRMLCAPNVLVCPIVYTSCVIVWHIVANRAVIILVFQQNFYIKT